MADKPKPFDFEIRLNVQEYMTMSMICATATEIMSHRPPCCDYDKDLYGLLETLCRMSQKTLAVKINEFLGDLTEEQKSILRLGAALGPIIPKAGGFPEELLGSDSVPKTVSTSKDDTGPVGDLLNSVMKSAAEALKGATKKKREKHEPKCGEDTPGPSQN